MTEKKNQHYIPKFYLRNFSYQANKKQIGIYSITNEIYFQRAKLKTQGSKNFFYGYDGLLEEGLSKIEDQLAHLIRRIIMQTSVPKKMSEEHIELLIFAILTDLRNPIKIEGIKNMFREMGNRLLELHPQTDTEKFIPTMSHDEVIQMSFSKMPDMAHMISDLDYKLLINNTNKPFVSSDFPVVCYNQFLEKKRWFQSKTGFGAVGLQIFIPLNSQITILFFDPAIYKVGDKKQKIFRLTKEHDIEQINILQFLNCLETIYFDDRGTESYLRHLHKQSKKYKKAHITKSELSHLFKDGEDINEKRSLENRNLVIVGSTDCEINLLVEGIKIHSRGQSHQLNPTIAQLRPHAAEIRAKRNRR